MYSQIIKRIKEKYLAELEEISESRGNTEDAILVYRGKADSSNDQDISYLSISKETQAYRYRFTCGALDVSITAIVLF